MAYQYLTFFLHDEAKLEEIRREYGAGRMKTYDVKQMLVEVLQEIVREHQVSLKQACRDLALEEGKKNQAQHVPSLSSRYYPSTRSTGGSCKGHRGRGRLLYESVQVQDKDEFDLETSHDARHVA